MMRACSTTRQAAEPRQRSRQRRFDCDETGPADIKVPVLSNMTGVSAPGPRAADEDAPSRRLSRQ
jgi:hypothetical protein